MTTTRFTDERLPLTPGTPHSDHAQGLMTVARVASLLGLDAKSIRNRMSEGGIPVTHSAGVARVEPLVAWAMRWGIRDAERLHQVAAFISKNKASPSIVDDTIELCERFLAEQEVTGKRRRRKADGPTEPPRPA